MIDDSEDVLYSLVRLLENAFPGIPIVAQSSPIQGLAVARGGNFRLILCDYRMPGVNGLQVLAQIRREQADTILVLMTAYPDLDVAIDAVNQARVQAFLRKPLDPATFIQHIRQLWEEAEAGSAASSLGRIPPFPRRPTLG